MSEEKQNPQGYDDDQTVPMLLTHLKQLRRSVPVNYQLKADLKKQLLQRMKELEGQKKTPDVSLSKGRRKLLRAGLATIIVSLAFVSYGWWTKDAVSIREHNLLTLPAHSTAEQVDIDSTGTQVAYLSQPSVLRTLSLDKDQKPLTVKLPPTEGKYLSLSWANHGKQIAVVEQQKQLSRLWIVDMPDAYNMGSSRLLKEEEEGVLYQSPSWSQNDDTIAYSRTKNGVQEIWVSSTVSFQEWKLAEGSQPEWSPDGRFLSYKNDGEIRVMEMRTGKITVLGKGEWPSWSTDSQLTYTTPEGKLAEILLEEQPTVTREVTLFNRSSEKLIRANWSAKGKQLLLISHDEEPEALVISLASR